MKIHPLFLRHWGIALIVLHELVISKYFQSVGWRRYSAKRHKHHLLNTETWKQYKNLDCEPDTWLWFAVKPSPTAFFLAAVGAFPAKWMHPWSGAPLRERPTPAPAPHSTSLVCAGAVHPEDLGSWGAHHVLRTGKGKWDHPGWSLALVLFEGNSRNEKYTATSVGQMAPFSGRKVRSMLYIGGIEETG